MSLYKCISCLNFCPLVPHSLQMMVCVKFCCLFLFFLRIQALYKLLLSDFFSPRSYSSNCPTMYILLKQTVHPSFALSEIWAELFSHTLDDDSLSTKKGLLSLLLQLKGTELSFYLLMMWIIYSFQPSSGLFLSVMLFRSLRATSDLNLKSPCQVEQYTHNKITLVLCANFSSRHISKASYPQDRRV